MIVREETRDLPRLHIYRKLSGAALIGEDNGNALWPQDDCKLSGAALLREEARDLPRAHIYPKLSGAALIGEDNGNALWPQDDCKLLGAALIGCHAHPFLSSRRGQMGPSQHQLSGPQIDLNLV